MLPHIVLLLLGKSGWAAHCFSFCFRSCETRLRSLNQQVALKFGNGIQYLHCHPAGCAGQINATKGKAMNPNAACRQVLNGHAHVHCVTT
ncbi:MAG: hypothetical protein GAK33_03002 [Burkholderia lata]|uniref:Uncharacterized protein n=1 Tax=Burkholderia lata (strain ATCC 17760 / DSM 23089 / LMG 22485 / NCIMB 9086 / R18194 / 383) TaxID=482957 RepID=A0A833PTV4_BURL3|nr:MAG: hypothetical protein GAK33_03002 [Burkholderia lata]